MPTYKYLIFDVDDTLLDFYPAFVTAQSHLWDCGPRWGITLDSGKWKRNVLDFWNMHKTDPNRDYIAGYCVHILTDWLNDIKIWSPLVISQKQ